MPNEHIIDNDFKNDEEYDLDELYDNALDDGPMLIDHPPCLVVTTLCEDKNDILAACDDTLTHESYFISELPYSHHGGEAFIC